MSVSDVFLGAEFEYVSRSSVSLSPFALHQTYVTADAYLCVSLGACWRYSGHDVTSQLSRVILV